MDIAMSLVAAMMFPLAGLALLLWLTRLEETLPGAVESARRDPEPPPILAIPIASAEPAPALQQVTVAIPEQRAPEAEPVRVVAT